MSNKKLKYLAYLEKFPDCPCPEKYREVNREAYRWVKNQEGVNDFIPLNLIKAPPPRMLDDSDKMCKGYGLSMFSTLQLAAVRYKKGIEKFRTHIRQQKIKEYGREIALLKLTQNDGVSGDFNSDSGHFTFHEYEGAELTDRIIQIFNIFDEDGKFVIYQ